MTKEQNINEAIAYFVLALAEADDFMTDAWVGWYAADVIETAPDSYEAKAARNLLALREEMALKASE